MSANLLISEERFVEIVWEYDPMDLKLCDGTRVHVRRGDSLWAEELPDDSIVLHFHTPSKVH